MGNDDDVETIAAPTITSSGFAASDAKSPLKPYEFERRAPGPYDVLIDIAYCGVCHSDIHQARDEWHNTVWPCLPGHEIVGHVTQAGEHVTKFKVGDAVGVGCMVDSCRNCTACQAGLEQYCEGPHGFLATYNGPFKADGSNTFGGYSTNVVVNEDFVLRIPEGMDLASTAPLLCSGVTTFSPLRHWKIGAGHKVAIVGIGGLGHVAIQIAKALGAEVVAVTTSPEKTEDAKHFGASDVIVSTDHAAMAKHARSFDYLLSTIPDPHDINPYVQLLKRDGIMTIVGMLAPMAAPIATGEIAFARRSVSGSLIGGIAETQEILDFCSEHGIRSHVQPIRLEEINDAFDRVVKKQVRYRFVIDLAATKP
jgi:uncharacterized zinc-type alcohol dehydrogenase-like protein